MHVAARQWQEHVQPHTHACTHARTYTHTHARTHTNTRTHIHTHASSQFAWREGRRTFAFEARGGLVAVVAVALDAARLGLEPAVFGIIVVNRVNACSCKGVRVKQWSNGVSAFEC